MFDTTKSSVFPSRLTMHTVFSTPAGTSIGPMEVCTALTELPASGMPESAALWPAPAPLLHAIDQGTRDKKSLLLIGPRLVSYALAPAVASLACRGRLTRSLGCLSATATHVRP